MIISLNLSKSIIMKTRYFIIFVLSILFWSCASDKLHTETYREKPILVGKAHRSDLKQAPYNQWFDKNYQDYQPEKNSISKLKPLINNFKFIVLMGTWCGDSQEQVPVFFKVLDAAGYKNINRLTIYTLPRKYGKTDLGKAYHLQRVPTIIVYEKGKDIGRIIEYPMQSIESDLLQIMTKKGYRHELEK